MASIDKIKRKIGASKGVSLPKTPKGKGENGSNKGKDSKSGSVISVKEAVTGDQYDMLEKGDSEKKVENEQGPQPGPSSSHQNPASTTSSRPTSARKSRPVSASSTRSVPSSPPQALQERPGSAHSQKSKEAWIQDDNPSPSRPTSALSKTSNRGSPSTPANTANMSQRLETNVSPIPGKSGLGSGLFRSNNTVHPQQRQPGPLASSSQSNIRSPSNLSSGYQNNEVTSMGPAEMNEAHAYVPYLYARDSITKIVQDMKNMKITHIRIVHDIEDNFRAIEDETQAQFNLFVVNLRDQYGIKVKTFRQVIEVHRLELQQKEQYWDELLMSLSARNKSLLQDKKVLLIQNKLEFERLEKQKVEAVQALQKQLDEENSRHATEKRDIQKKFEGDIVVLTTQHDEEKKVISDALEKEKVENVNLQKEIEELKKRLTFTMAASRTEHQVSAEPVVVVAEMTEEERLRIKEERDRMIIERETMTSDRKEIEKERELFVDERNKFQEERIVIQGDLNNAHKAKEEWKARYESLKAQLGDLANIKAKYDVMAAQYAAVCAIAIAAAVDNKEKIDENIQKAQADKDIMAEEKLQMERDIKKWEEDFKKKNGRDPEEKDKTDSIKELEISLAEAVRMVSTLDTQITTLETLKKGEVPEKPPVAPTPIEIREPEIKTIEVKVPDPEVLASLQATQMEVDKLKSELATSKGEASDLHGDISKLEAEIGEAKVQISMLEAKISGLEEQNAALEEKLIAAAIGASVGVAVSGEDTEALKAEYEAKIKKLEKAKKAAEKDIKKILAAQAKGDSSAETERVKKLLEITVKEVREVNGQAEKAATLVDEKLKLVKSNKDTMNKENEEKKKKYEQWASEWKKKNGKEPTSEERDGDNKGKKLFADSVETSANADDHDLTVQALEMIATGAVPEKLAPKVEQITAAVSIAAAAENETLVSKVDDLQDQLDELTGLNEKLKKEKKDLSEDILGLQSKLAVGIAVSTGDDLEELSGQISELQKQVDEAESRLEEERSAHSMTRDELEAIQAQLEALKSDLETQKTTSAADLDAATSKLKSEISNLEKKFKTSEARVEELDKARLANVPMDAQKEIKSLKAKLTATEKEKDANITAKANVEAEMKQLNAKLTNMEKSSTTQKAASTGSEQKLKQLKAEKDKEIKEVTAKFEKKQKERVKQDEKKIGALEKKIQQLEIAAASAGAASAVSAGKGKPDKGGVDKATQEKLRETQKELKDAQNKIKQLENELKSAQKSGGPSAEDMREKKKQEKILKELEKRLEMITKKNEKNEHNLQTQGDELEEANKDNAAKTKEIAVLKAELEGLGVAAAEGIEAAAKVKDLETEVKNLTEENKVLADNYNSERVLRKKYYNMVEDMKGKIRVYCRVRPMSKSETGRGNHDITKSPDEYTITVDSSRGTKEFQFDSIFMPDHSQEKVFEDTNNLVQSAVDGYNVCIFAYGQTGSGKTYTIIGDSQGQTPGIAPRAFDRIFQLADEVKSKFTVKITVYMLELYNDKLLDLFAKSAGAEDKLDIRKDKKGMVVVQGAEIKSAKNANELWSLFEEGSKTRHVASTKMNDESSRSHLVVGIVIESTNKVSGQVTKGKLSLVDLAGSERAAKTDASAEQLKEAMSINKSLSALGDVISALSSEQTFIPYRNNKLTMLMQDSLGGNAKTLMFVNVSPADYNADETVTSLTYAARVKLITNDASKNADNKEINRLKSVIAKLKAGEAVETIEEEDETQED